MFTFPDMSEEKVVIDKEVNQIVEKPNDLKVFMWKRQWDGVNTSETEYKKYQRAGYPVILRQCSPALWAQLEGSKGFEKIKANQ